MNHRIESMKPSASMVLMARAKEMQKTDPTVIGLAGGEPDFPTPDRISMAAIRSLTEGYTHYVVGPGLPELRAAIRKKLLEENKTAQAFVDAMKQAYPGLPGETGLEDLGKALYQ